MRAELLIDAIVRQVTVLIAQLATAGGVRAPLAHVCSDFSIPLDAESGWEAAVLDHVQAVVRTIVQRLSEPGRAGGEDEIGGSTYSFDVWPGHPLEGEVRQCLKRFRSVHGALRARVEAHNRAHGVPAQHQQVVVYGGQHVLTRGDG